MAESKSDTISATYRPGPGDPDQTEAFGMTFEAGEAVDVPAQHAGKIRGNPYFAVKGEKTYGDDMVDAESEDQDEASFEDNVVRERSEEYLSGKPMFTTALPGDAERVARAQEAAREMQESAESDDADKPRRGRPPKAK